MSKKKERKKRKRRERRQDAATRSFEANYSTYIDEAANMARETIEEISLAIEEYGTAPKVEPSDVT